jgi:glycosyltransferase involved in cell wall biosynthesis
VLDQDFPEAEFEIIVVNDSGKPLPPADWQSSGQVRVITTNHRERIFARTTGAAVAMGDFLHFLDDDDWLAPGALQNMHSLAQDTRADWLYGSSQLVDRQGKPILQLHHGMHGNCFIQVMSGEWIPLQASWIRTTAFFAAGGYTALIDGAEDVDLSRKIVLRGDMAGVEAIVALIGMGTEGSSTDYNKAPDYSRWAREKILNEPGVLPRLLDSARQPAWHGRIPRIYLTSAVWNMRNGKGFTAISRALFGAASVVMAGKYLLSPEYWRALSRSYQSVTFAKGQTEASLQAQRIG